MRALLVSHSGTTPVLPVLTPSMLCTCDHCALPTSPASCEFEADLSYTCPSSYFTNPPVPVTRGSSRQLCHREITMIGPVPPAGAIKIRPRLPPCLNVDTTPVPDSISHTDSPISVKHDRCDFRCGACFANPAIGLFRVKYYVDFITLYLPV